jgi:hypothetical protein
MFASRASRSRCRASASCRQWTQRGHTGARSEFRSSMPPAPSAMKNRTRNGGTSSMGMSGVRARLDAGRWSAASRSPKAHQPVLSLAHAASRALRPRGPPACARVTVGEPGYAASASARPSSGATSSRTAQWGQSSASSFGSNGAGVSQMGQSTSCMGRSSRSDAAVVTKIGTSFTTASSRRSVPASLSRLARESRLGPTIAP